MSVNNSIEIHKDLKPYMNEIADRLWAIPGHAAIMVGAGFSKNANSDFPDWSALGKTFYEKIHGKEASNSDLNFLNVLKLADEVDAAFGRPVLDQILRTSIPEKESFPSHLHIDLMKLPWTDVFTTNYDTLLERACETISNRKYDVIINKEDLVYSDRPRIIKLHGSFPSERPFIITEEDFRIYPQLFAPFVNTVQQSLLENILCLVGFSSDDPNFLKWIGWIRDNLGENNSSKIFLVGVIKLSSAQIKLLDKRNITVINMEKCNGVGDDHYKALEVFFNYLANRNKIENQLRWPPKSKIKHSGSDVDFNNIIDEWAKIRILYPKWRIAPQESRSSLALYTSGWEDFLTSQLSNENNTDLKFIYELNWRLEKALNPLTEQLAESFENILYKYWPFKEGYPEVLKNDKEIKINKNKNKNIKIMWLSILLALFRFYRENGNSRSWGKVCKILLIINDNLSNDERAFIKYQRILNALFNLNIMDFSSELDSWEIDYSMPYWEARRAAILAEIGLVEEAESILIECLQLIRAQLNPKPLNADYSLASEEALLMVILKSLKKANLYAVHANSVELEKMKDIYNNNNNIDDYDEVIKKYSIEKSYPWKDFISKKDDKTRTPYLQLLQKVRNLDFEKLSRSLDKRWNDLKYYNCDPIYDITMFTTKLSHEVTESSSTIYNFDVGNTSQHFSFIDTSLVAYNFLRYLEESGHPISLPKISFFKSSVNEAIKRIGKNSSYWAVITLIRMRDEKVVDLIYNRQFLLKLSIEKVDEQVEIYLKTLTFLHRDLLLNKINKYNDEFNILIAKIVPEILSRLCSKCSFKQKKNIIKILNNIYNSPFANHYLGIKNLIKRALNTVSEDQLIELIPDLTNFSCPKGLDFRSRDNFIPPLIYVKWKVSIEKIKNIQISTNKFGSLITILHSDDLDQRDWAMVTLMSLFDLGLLSSTQKKQFGMAYWSQLGEDGLPQTETISKNIILYYPCPSNIDSFDIFKKYIRNLEFPIEGNSLTSYRMTGGHIPLCKALIHSMEYIPWSEQELEEWLYLLKKWWDSDKMHLKENLIFQRADGSRVVDEFRRRFCSLQDVLIELIPKIKKSVRNKLTISVMISEFAEYDLPVLNLKIVNNNALQKPNTGNIIEEIKYSLLDEGIDFQNGVKALYYLLLKDTEKQKVNKSTESIVEIISQIILWRNQNSLIKCLKIMEIIVDQYPYYFTQKVQKMCKDGLGFLEKETELTVYMEKAEFHKTLALRRGSSKLASKIHSYYIKGKIEIPNEIKVWESVGASENEFLEIRIHWGNK